MILGVLLSTDSWIFRKFIPWLADTYANKPSIVTWIASITYGGAIEEVMMRLFVMSFIVFVVWKVFFREKKEVPTSIFVFANILSAILFATGHLPSTITMYGAITVPVLLRTYLINCAGGLCFGYFYRTYGIQYAMLSHMGHILCGN